MSTSIQEEIAQWLGEFEAHVRAVDYAGARPYVADDLVGFGTYGAVLRGREEVERGQWAMIWPTIRNFSFRIDQLSCGTDGSLAWAACPWDSDGVRDDGSVFDRPGRATIVFRREGGRWRAIHTHFSLFPRQ